MEATRPLCQAAAIRCLRSMSNISSVDGAALS